eukprot:CAMPEP_0173211152 /NCGR_PEP_ID=MMETSP1141-20130122/24071_1 /TAXON_ID=483371 /ORGANISM="non described non described, Strain CCMP2298" /LENGTH=96 /DNA_ID=CAMNT_0014137999 /DNA_START=162 /DNA_END=452 /DNA_ORIENTATION=+
MPPPQPQQELIPGLHCHEERRGLHAHPAHHARYACYTARYARSRYAFCARYASRYVCARYVAERGAHVQFAPLHLVYPGAQYAEGVLLYGGPIVDI